ncbi:hypothetical protein TRFO_32314 [Tritrichomonas foetus]|uniref:Uncharacterized protein n=1 Tax=Tritrichomonas foetus TaxID=1144522 RepID=A0A1J4JR52_9EUKA|nr:hypothetical protein TRFO_32314 [Tritrichomonas foetus]|eukprot:OHT00888.1 hypothetical protein TRFO_32314 [Tritrichomonas foetus]
MIVNCRSTHNFESIKFHLTNKILFHQFNNYSIIKCSNKFKFLTLRKIDNSMDKNFIGSFMITKDTFLLGRSSLALVTKFLKFFQPGSLIGLLLLALLIQTNYMYVNYFFQNDVLRLIIYVVHIVMFITLSKRIPTGFVEFLFPNFIISDDLINTDFKLTQDIENINLHIINQQSDVNNDDFFNKLNKTELSNKQNENDETKLLNTSFHEGEQIPSHEKVTNNYHLTNESDSTIHRGIIVKNKKLNQIVQLFLIFLVVFKDPQSILERMDVLTLSGMTTIILAFLLLMRSGHSLALMIHIFVCLLFGLCCLIGFNVVIDSE